MLTHLIRQHSIPTRLILALLAIFVFLIFNRAYAIVNLENIHIGKPEEGTTGSLSMGIDGAEGNSERITGSLGSRIQWHHDTNTRFIALNAAYGKSFGQEDQNKSFLHLRNIEQMTDFMAWEVFTQAEHNKFARLSFRGLLGGGIRLSLTTSSEHSSSNLGLGAFLSREILEKKTNTDDGGAENIGRANLYWIHKQRIAQHTTFLNTIYLQPAIDDVEDFRLLENARLHIKITDAVGLSLNIEIFHDSQPPELIDDTDIHYSTQVHYRF